MGEFYLIVTIKKQACILNNEIEMIRNWNEIKKKRLSYTRDAF